FEARVLGSGPSAGDAFIDAAIRVRGVAETIFTMRGDPVRRQVLVPALKHVEIREPAAPDPFSIPLASIRALRDARPGTTPAHRVRVQGVLTDQPDGTA